MAQLPTPSETMVVHLLDPAFQRPVKSWKFQGKASVSIGRGDDCDVELNDPYVSRLHVELQNSGSAWRLVSRGRNGVTIQGKQVDDTEVASGAVFRLGAGGPTLRFELTSSQTSTSNDNPATLCFDTAEVGLFLLDSKKIDREVEQIASGDYFQTLQQRARELRQKKKTS